MKFSNKILRKVSEFSGYKKFIFDDIEVKEETSKFSALLGNILYFLPNITANQKQGNI